MNKISDKEYDIRHLLVKLNFYHKWSNHYTLTTDKKCYDVSFIHINSFRSIELTVGSRGLKKNTQITYKMQYEDFEKCILEEFKHEIRKQKIEKIIN